jgi:hypothetical protein
MSICQEVWQQLSFLYFLVVLHVLLLTMDKTTVTQVI